MTSPLVNQLGDTLGQAEAATPLTRLNLETGPEPVKKTRSKAGCLVCRSRRVKCDNGQSVLLCRVQVLNSIARPSCEKCVKYGAEVSPRLERVRTILSRQCVFPPTKRFDLSAISTSLAKRHKSSGNASLALSPEQLQKLIPESSSSTPHAYGATISSHLVRAAYEDPKTGSQYRIPLSLDRENGEEAQSMDYMPPLFTIEELMKFFRQTQMGSYYRQPAEPPDFLRPVFPDPDDRRCVSVQMRSAVWLNLHSSFTTV
jgi:hypothetical protein